MIPLATLEERVKAVAAVIGPEQARAAVNAVLEADLAAARRHRDELLERRDQMRRDIAGGRAISK